MEKERLNKEVASISLSDVVTVTKMGHITEIQYMQKMNHTATIKKLSKDEYCDLATGEIKNSSIWMSGLIVIILCGKHLKNCGI